ncbi:MAG: protein kinase, partial [Planctomycetes bacterium]|nr:protein kinase [Planctomycetota bacterium]
MQSDEVGRRYEILAVIGEGGTGRVYRALDRLSRKEVALKRLAAGGEAGGRLLAAEEFRFLASHRHPHLARVFDYGLAPDGRPYFTMELCRGEDLSAYVRRRLPPPPRRAGDPRLAEIVRQILVTLEFLHSRNILHRDLKPANILVDEMEEEGGAAPAVKLVDFGLARRVDARREAVSGTVEYLSPERLREEREDPRSDLYSLGVILHEILSGEVPFRGETAGDVIEAHLRREPPELPSELGAWADVTRRLLEKDPRSRPRDAADVLSRLFGEDARRDPPIPSFASVLVGRDDLLSRLVRRAQSASSGDGAAALLSGPLGIGKSRLLHEVRWRLQIEEMPVISESCEEHDSPGHLMRRILRQLGFAPTGGERADRQIERLLAELEPEGGEPEGGVTEIAAEDLAHAFARLLLDAARARPCVLLIDDLHLADSLSREAIALLARMVERSRPCFLSFITAADGENRADAARGDAGERSRPEHLGQRETPDRPASGLPSAETIAVSELCLEDVERYAEELLGRAGVFPAEFLQTLHADSGGNPLFIEEFLRMLLERGALVWTRDGWQLERAAELRVPGSLEELAARSIARLEGFPRRVVEWSAALAEPFAVEEIAELMERSADPDAAGRS